jgi:hypothetical protein
VGLGDIGAGLVSRGDDYSSSRRLDGDSRHGGTVPRVPSPHDQLRPMGDRTVDRVVYVTVELSIET